MRRNGCKPTQIGYARSGVSTSLYQPQHVVLHAAFVTHEQERNPGCAEW